MARTSPDGSCTPCHLSPAQAVNIHYFLEPDASVAIHFGTFALATMAKQSQYVIFARLWVIRARIFGF
jgi:hypothetical protein